MPKAINTKSGAWSITFAFTFCSPHWTFFPAIAVLTYLMPELPVDETMAAWTCVGQSGMNGAKSNFPDELYPYVIESP